MASRTIIDLLIVGALAALSEAGRHSYHVSPEYPIPKAKFLQDDNPSRELTVAGRIDYAIVELSAQFSVASRSRDCNDVTPLTSFAPPH